MPTELQWIASLPASALTAAEAIGLGQAFVDPTLAVALDQPARKLIVNIQRFTQQPGLVNSTTSSRGLKPAFAPTAVVNPEQLFDHLIPLSTDNSGLLRLAESALMKVSDRSVARENASRLAELVRQLTTAFQGAMPDVLAELEARGQPLRQQWEARGPGLLAALARLLEPDVIPVQAKVILIHPLFGGDGRAYIPYNSVRCEAILADPDPRLPEILRLAWLIAQLNCDLAKFQGNLRRDEVLRAAALAMIPVVLAGAEELEIVQSGPATLKLAIEAWRIPNLTNASSAEGVVSALLQWWETYQTSRPAWQIALAALSKMTEPTSK